MKKENLQNLKKYLENTISAYFKISQDLQNLQFNDNNYLDYFIELKSFIYKKTMFFK
jgi:hypothetical protein